MFRPLRWVMRVWAKELAKEGVTFDWQKVLPSPKGFRVLPRRWVVEQQKDEQGLREAVRNERGVHLRWDE